MARHESDREDLLREASAFPRRIEFHAPGHPEPIFAGLRDDGRFSVYFGADPAFHFDEQGRLRRAYRESDLYRTQGTTLARLRRTRTAHETTLLRTDLSSEQCRDFLQAMQQRLIELRSLLVSGGPIAVRQIPDGVELIPEIVRAIDRVLAEDSPLAPPVSGRKG